MGKKGPVGELQLVLKPDPVQGLMVSHCMLEDHYLQHLLHLFMEELALVDEGYDLVFRAWMPSSGHWHMSKRSSSQKCQKWSLDLKVVTMASNTCYGDF